MTSIVELRYGNTNCYCVNGKLMIDTDWAGTLPLLFLCAKAHGVELGEVKQLIITHFHPDHMGLAGELSRLGIELAVFEEQREYVHSSDAILERDKRVRFRPIDDSSVRFIPISESRSFLKQLGIDGEVVHTPHHSEDSISLVLDDGAAFVGDLAPLQSASAYNDPELDECWRKILSLGVDRIYYGHARAYSLDKSTEYRRK